MAKPDASSGSSGATDKPFILTREFAAPRELVFDAWTDPKHLQNWFGPKGTSIAKCDMDLRPGGVFHYGMATPDGKMMWGKWVIREVVRPERLVIVSSFSDEKRGTTRHPMAPEWPVETLSTTTFAAKGDRTVLTLRWEPINATEAERKTFGGAHDGMKAGWGGTMERLDAYLATVKGK